MPVSPVLKSTLLIAAAATMGIAAFAAGRPTALVADVTASLASTTAVKPHADQPAEFASAADAQAQTPITTQEPAGGEPAEQNSAANGGPSAEALLTGFKTWAAESEAPVEPRLTQPVRVTVPVQVPHDDPAPVAEDDPAPTRRVQRHRQVRAIRHAREEPRAQNPRKQVRRTQIARAPRPPVQDARAQASPVQDAQAPSFLTPFAPRN